jgi:DMSO/TMAO reductase YedYZ molybdopterin-dependent catalytic subunit
MDRRKFLKIVLGLGVIVGASGSVIAFLLDRLRARTSEHLPPGQYEAPSLQVLHVGSIPAFDPSKWTFEVSGLVVAPFTVDYDQLKEIRAVNTVSDFHCVTGWSTVDNRWRGVQVQTLLAMANVRSEARYATFECDGGYTTSLPLADLRRHDVMLAYQLDGQMLPPQHGGPLRLVVPHKYGYKSAKWVRRIRVTAEQELGYWETRGFSNTADPLTDDRYR